MASKCELSSDSEDNVPLSIFLSDSKKDASDSSDDDMPLIHLTRDQNCSASSDEAAYKSNFDSNNMTDLSEILLPQTWTNSIPEIFGA